MQAQPDSEQRPHGRATPAGKTRKSNGLPERDFIDAVARGLAILESFGTDRQRLNATQAAERAGLTRAAARRHLLTLNALGYLESDGHAFWLGPKMLRFSGSYLASARLPRLVQPVLHRLGAQSHAAHSVVVQDHSEVVIVARSMAPEHRGPLLAHGLHLGARLPMHATSTGRVLLAALAPQALADWLAQASAAHGMLTRLTPHTETDPQRLLHLIEEVRQQGYCLSSDAHELGVCALAVPLIDTRGHTHAALNVVAASGRDTQAWMHQQLPLLREAAQELRPML